MIDTPPHPHHSDVNEPHSALPWFGHKYEVTRLVGEGAMASVYEARHVRLGQRVALKVPHAEFRFQEQAARRFAREARALARVHDPHVARVLDVEVMRDGTPIMVMEYLEGRDLAEELAVRGRLPLDEAVSVVLQACQGVARAHAAGLVHRDLKPENLFLQEEGKRRTVKVIDFGVSKDQCDSFTETRMMLGTPNYMAPEQIRSSRAVDERADVWGLGAILYELVTGRPPFPGTHPARVIASVLDDPVEDPRRYASNVSPALARVILRALDKDPKRRFATAPLFARALAAVVGRRRPLSPMRHGVPSRTVPMVPKPLSIVTAPRRRRPRVSPTPARSANERSSRRRSLERNLIWLGALVLGMELGLLATLSWF